MSVRAETKICSEKAPPSQEELSRFIKRSAREVGFDLVGLAPAVIGLGSDRLDRWLAEGRHGQMEYMAEHRDVRVDPNRVLQGVRSVVVGAMVYRTACPEPTQADAGRISRYAWGEDYHDVLRSRLAILRERIIAVDRQVRCRAVVDSAPVMERDYAELAGLGWIGKNTLLLNEELGSWFFLGALLIDRELDYDTRPAVDHCGTCTRCLEACPTQAFDGPYRLDPRRCISYLTIEHRSGIPEELRLGLGDWIFGCDICQEVCPWNTKGPVSKIEEFRPAEETNPASLAWLLRMDEAEFRKRFKGTPLLRTKRERVLRNAALVAGNQRTVAVLAELKALTLDPDPSLREAANWAIERIAEASCSRSPTGLS